MMLQEALLPKGYKELENVTGVYVSDNEIVITGIPEEDNEDHNCDVLGCSSINHVLIRVKR